MGTEIYLKVHEVVIDWSKNFRGRDHGALFQEINRTHIHSNQTNYAYCAEHGIDTKPQERAFVSPLKNIIPRLELLGYTITSIKQEYEKQLTDWLNFQNLPPLNFEEFIGFLTRHPLKLLSNIYIEHTSKFSTENICKRFTTDPAFYRIPITNPPTGYSETSYFSSLIEFLHPYSILRLLALVPDNLPLDVTWHYGPLVDNGWAEEAEFVPNARRHQTFLIATEGSSDVHILKHAISLLMPEVEDFFKFIDVIDRHPFSGTGSLVKFAEGLIKIDIQNKIIILFDNDAEGWAALGEVQRYKPPSNMRTITLPELDEFKLFDTFGPQGLTKGNINRQAAAIECYLDLNLKNRPPAKILWTNYKNNIQSYQGSLEYKETYADHFMKQTNKSIAKGNYDISKIKIMLDKIFQECCSISAQQSG